jgi:hypothetical protein
MRFFCWFSLCNWIHLFNARMDGLRSNRSTIEKGAHVVGVYQCPRCKTVSVGVARDTNGNTL